MLREEIFSNAKFVKSSEPCVSTCFRTVINIDNPEKAVINVCGLGVFRLFINGQKVSDDVLAPVTSFYHQYDNCYCTKEFGEIMSSRIYCMQYDVASYLKSGANSICAVVAPGWYHMYSDECIFCFRLQCGDETFVSDESIKWLDSPITESVFSRGEKLDFTKHNYDGKWLLPEYDDCEWKNAVEAVIPETDYYIQDCPNDKLIRSIECKKIFENDKYEVYDAGENITGWPVFRCAEKGRTVHIAVGEEITEDGDLHEKWIHHQESEFVCDGCDREYHLLFVWQGFRYIRIDKGAQLLRCDVIHTDVEVTADFRCENAVLNQLFDAYKRTQLCNLHMGIPSDCPHLERRGYTGDGQNVAEAAMLLFDGRKFYLKWMEDIADCQDINSGHIQYTAPYVPSGGGPGGWGCAIAEVPYMYYKVYGDSEPFRKYFDNMFRYFDYLEAHSENDLVISDQPNQWCLGDWCAPQEKHGTRPAIPEPFVNNYFYVRTIDRMLEMCDLVGRSADKEKLTALRKIKVDAIMKNYFDEATGNFANNLNSANAFALDIKLGDERTLANLVEAVRTKPLDTGIFGTDLVAKILFGNGYSDEAIDFLSRDEYPSFGFMFKNNATTLWEEWQDPRSMSHPMFGSVIKYLFFFILGIRRASDAGFDKIIIEPKTNKITGNAEGYITTEKGRIFVSVRDGVLNAEIPEGVEAEIIFDGEANIKRV